MKTIAAFTRRQYLSRQAFRDYYESTHAVLGMTHFPFTKYVRNHVVEPPPTMGGVDCISEFFVDDWARSAEATKGATGELFAADEARFMDRDRIRSAVVEETLLAGPPRDIDAQGAQRRMLCLDLPAGADPEAAIRALKAWSAALGAGGRRVTLDVVTGPVAASFPYDAPFPYDALVSIWTPEPEEDDAPPPPPGYRFRAELMVDVCDSAPDVMASLYAPP